MRNYGVFVLCHCYAVDYIQILLCSVWNGFGGIGNRWTLDPKFDVTSTTLSLQEMTFSQKIRKWAGNIIQQNLEGMFMKWWIVITKNLEVKSLPQ